MQTAVVERELTDCVPPPPAPRGPTTIEETGHSIDQISQLLL